MTKDSADEILSAARSWASAAVRYSGAPQQEQAFLALLNSMIDDTKMNKTEVRIAAEYTDEHTATKSTLYFAQCPVCHAKLDWAETGKRFVSAQTPAELAAENALCNAAYLSKKTE